MNARASNGRFLLRTDEREGSGKTTLRLSTLNAGRLSPGLNKCHAPISRIKPFEHLLSLALPSLCFAQLMISSRSAFFSERFTCLQCLVEPTQVCKAAVTARLSPESAGAEPRN